MLSRKMIVPFLVFITLTMLVGIAAQLALGRTPASAAEVEMAAPAPKLGEWAHAATVLSIALSVGAGCIGAGMAVSNVGAAAIGAISERPELTGRVLMFVGLAEGIAIYGLIVSVLLWRML